MPWAGRQSGREEIGELRRAAGYDWRDVDPSIFGTLLEQALDPRERRRLGAHYTPRAYVERLVVATVIEPLRADWDQALSTAERQKSEGRMADAVATIGAFHEALCRTRVLDPACGSGNFLYVSLELLKRLEGEGRVLYRYCSPEGSVDEGANINGAAHSIAGVVNERGNVLGMMPHPENHVEDIMGCTDGRGLFAGLVAHLDQAA